MSGLAQRRLAFSASVLGMMLVMSVCQTAVCQTSPVSSGRKLVPDALEIIPPGTEYGETFQGPVDLPLVVEHPELAWTPEFSPVSDTLLEKAKQVVFRGESYSLEFAFKPVRMLQADIQTKAGIERKTVWYLLYRVRYLGGDLKPKSEEDQYNNLVYAIPEAVSAKWVRFLPLFSLQSNVSKQRKTDQILPEVKQAIAAKERVGSPLYDSVEISRRQINISTVSDPLAADPNAVWGIATWTDIDPRTDFFSVEVQGLTNAQRLVSDGDQLQYLQKVLVLYFSRPGDDVDELQDRIRYGIPALENKLNRLQSSTAIAAQRLGVENGRPAAALAVARTLENMLEEMSADPVLQDLTARLNDLASDDEQKRLDARRAMRKANDDALQALTDAYRLELAQLQNNVGPGEIINTTEIEAQLLELRDRYRANRARMVDDMRRMDSDQAFELERLRQAAELRSQGLERISSLLGQAINKLEIADADASWTGPIVDLLRKKMERGEVDWRIGLREIATGVAGSIRRQDYILLQYGQNERLDYQWIYR